MTYSIRTVREADATSIIEILNPIIEAGIYSIMDNHLQWQTKLNLFADSQHVASIISPSTLKAKRH